MNGSKTVLMSQSICWLTSSNPLATNLWKDENTY